MYTKNQGKGKKVMTDKQKKLVIGSLLHDIGKVVYRSGDGRNHSESGYSYLKTETKIQDKEILHCVRYHHAANLKGADLAKDDCAYITYYADNVAAFTDRREAQEQEPGFDKKIPLASVFNILNGNHGNSHYAMQVLNPEDGIHYPTEDEIRMDEQFYQTVIRNITDNLKGITLDEEYLNSLLSVLEANLSYIPSSTSKKELADISLYDHVKMTAAIASCVEQYLSEKGEDDYRDRLFMHAQQSYEEAMFLLYAMDISGIQNFIYTVGEQGALKGLRSRSFYLEIMMEHMVDELLGKLSLSRANLIYTGGGHCYLLLPHTETVCNVLADYEKELNQWFLEHFDTALFVGTGYAPASANALRNVPEGSYANLYLDISEQITAKKGHRYTADMIRKLNARKPDGERECKVCRRVAKLKAEEDKCPICRALEKMAGSVLEEDFFTIISEKEKDALPMPFGRYLVADSEQELLKRMGQDSYVRCYTKNRIYTGKHVTTKLWVGDYYSDKTFEELAQHSEGVPRIGILRADVDNLGMTFLYGFKGADGKGTYETLSRTATLSRQLSLFFKCYINEILRNGSTNLLGAGGARRAVIVYSGGDDVFLAGAWNDVIAAFSDLRQALERFSQGTLTISGGVGVYQADYPLNVMAKEVEHLENCSKKDGKNAITIFSTDHRYPWAEFERSVLHEKLPVLDAYFGATEDHGMAFLYHLVELLRNTGEKINTARYVYLLSRMEPQEEENKQKLEQYRRFSQKMYEWSKDETNRKELITAMYLYVYLNRTEGEETND